MNTFAIIPILIKQLHLLFVFTFDIDKNIIKVHYYKNVKFFYQDLIDAALEHGQCISQSKRYFLVLEMAIAAPEGRLPSIAFLDPYLMIGIGEIELNEMSSPT